MATSLAQVEAAFHRVNEELAAENLIRNLIASADNTNQYSLAIQDAKIAGLRNRAISLRTAIVTNFNGEYPGRINSHIEMNNDDEKPMSRRDRFVEEKICANCGDVGSNRCNICHKVRYCGVACWKADQAIHKLECKTK